MEIAAQIVMGITIILMVIGRTPLYTTAIVGATLAALIYGVPITGDGDDATIKSLVIGGMNPVIADMAGVLIFIGAMEHTGYLKLLVNAIIRQGNKLGGGPGVATSGGIAAGLIGAFTGFTQPAITAVVTGPASIKLGVDPHKSAGTHAHAGHLGNFAGFTHPTLLAVIATTGITFGWINAAGLATALVIFGFSFARMRGDVKHLKKLSAEETKAALADFQRKEGEPTVWWVLLPFLLLVVGFAMGYPVFAVGFIVSIIVMIMARSNPMDTEKSMLESVQRVAVPLIATIGFLFLSGVISTIGITDLLGGWFEPLIEAAPILTLILVSGVAGLLTQSNSASAAIILPMLTIVMAQGDVSPLAAAIAAAGPTAVMQYFLTGGPVAALATTVPVVPGSELKIANRFQRPSQLVGLLFVSAVAMLLGGF